MWSKSTRAIGIAGRSLSAAYRPEARYLISIVFPTPPTPRRCSAHCSASGPQQAVYRAGQLRAVEVACQRAAVLPTAGAEAEQPPSPVDGQFHGAGLERGQGLARGDELLGGAQVPGLDGLPRLDDDA